MGLKDWLLPKLNDDGTLSLGESEKKPKKTIEFIIMPRHILFGIVLFGLLIWYFMNNSPFETKQYVECVNGSIEEVEENKTTYCGEYIGNTPIDVYIERLQNEGRQEYGTGY